MNRIDTKTLTGWLAICVLVSSPFCVANAQTRWESAIRQNTPTTIELTLIEEEETKILIQGQANSHPDLGRYMRTLMEAVGEPSLLRATRENDKTIFALTIKKTQHPGNAK